MTRNIGIKVKAPKGEAKEGGQQPTNIHLHKELAKQYAAYKLAALNHIVGSGIVDEDLFWNLIIQNRR